MSSAREVRSPGVATGILFLLLLLPACGSGDTSSTADSEVNQSTSQAESNAGASAQIQDACSVLTSAEVSSMAGLGESTPESGTSGGAQVCTWSDETGKSVVLQIYPTAGHYEASREAFESFYDGQAEDLQGIGERSYYISGSTAGIATATVSAAQGGRAISVQVMALGEDVGALRGATEEIARAVIQKL